MKTGQHNQMRRHSMSILKKMNFNIPASYIHSEGIVYKTVLSDLVAVSNALLINGNNQFAQFNQKV